MQPIEVEAIVIGGSLGGMEALSNLISRLPKDFDLPIIVVLHRLKNVKSSLIEILQKRTPLKVIEAEEKIKLEKGHVYIAPANYHLLIEKDKTLSLDNWHPVFYSKPSIDVLFESASEVFKSKVMGILLTGANHDGSQGLKKIKDNGGIAIVQDPSESLSDTMPLAAINSFKVDRILNIASIAEVLLIRKL